MAQGVGPRWSSRMTYSLAAIGAAVGLGNIWKFPYMAGNGGGGAFVLVYLLALCIAAAPLFMAETLIGRLGRLSPPAAFRTIANTHKGKTVWPFFGYLGLFGVLLVLSFYSVIAGWTLSYIFKSVTGVFKGADAGQVAQIFDQFKAQPLVLMLWQGLFLLCALVIVGRGLLKGTERANRIVMPLLFLLLLTLLIYAVLEGAFVEALSYLFLPDWSQMTFSVALSAVGQALFTLGVGVGGIMAYGAYVGANISIARATLVVVVADTLVALLAGLMIFPIVFGHGLEPSQGAGLVFRTLPIALGQMPLGSLVGGLFFLLLFFGAITSAISMMEPGVMWLMERGRSRRQATLIFALGAWAFGLGTVFSFNIWANFYPLDFLPLFEEAHVFHIIDVTVNNYILPINGIAFCLFAGWVITSKAAKNALGIESKHVFRAWQWSVRVFAPLALFIILVASSI